MRPNFPTRTLLRQTRRGCGLGLAMTLLCTVISGGAGAQVVVSDPLLEGTTAASKATQGIQLAKQILQYEQQIESYATQLEQLRNILTKIQSLGSGISLVPKSLQPIGDTDADKLVELACPGASGAGILGNAISAIQATMGGSLVESQQNICMAVVRLQVDEYNITANALGQLTLQQSSIQKLGDVVNAISTIGESNSATSQAQGYLAQLQTASLTWKTQMDADEASIKALQQYQSTLAQTRLQGTRAVLGTVVQAGAFAAAFH
jgi:hypothetical protein